LAIDQKVLDTVVSVIGKGPHKLHEPIIGMAEQFNIDKVLESGHLSSGPWVNQFEASLAKFIGAKFCVATCSGTAALHAAYSVVFQTDKTILVPSLTFIATANPLMWLGIEPYFTDYNHGAKIAVPIIGHPVSDGYRFQDASQALGSKQFGKYIGATGTAIFSFNQNKPITTGGGGAIVTDDENLYRKLKHLTTTARIPHRWEVAHDAIGFNYRMPDINAAIGCAQLARLPGIIKAKRSLAQAYIEAFKSIPGVSVWEEPDGTESNYWLVAIKFESHDEQQMALWKLANAGIQARMLPKPLHLLPMYADCKRTTMDETEYLYRHIICLPSSPQLGLKYA